MPEQSRSSPGSPQDGPHPAGGAGLQRRFIPTGCSSGDRAESPSAAPSATAKRGQETLKRFQTTFCFVLFVAVSAFCGWRHISRLSAPQILWQTAHRARAVGNGGQTHGTSNGACTGIRNTRQQEQSDTAESRHPRSQGARSSRAQLPGTCFPLQGPRDNRSQTSTSGIAAQKLGGLRPRRPGSVRGGGQTSAGRAQGRSRRVPGLRRAPCPPPAEGPAAGAHRPTVPGGSVRGARLAPHSAGHGAGLPRQQLPEERRGGGRESLTALCRHGQPAEAARQGNDGEGERKCRKCPTHGSDAMKRESCGSRSRSCSALPCLLPPTLLPLLPRTRRAPPPRPTPRHGSAPSWLRPSPAAALWFRPASCCPPVQQVMEQSAARRCSPT